MDTLRDKRYLESPGKPEAPLGIQRYVSYTFGTFPYRLLSTFQCFQEYCVKKIFFDYVSCYRLKFVYKLAIGAFFSFVLLFLLLQTNAFLSFNRPVKTDVLVVEGWLPDYALEESMEIFKRGNYKKIVTTGGPLSVGSYLKEYRDLAHLSQATLLALGMKENEVVAVPAPEVYRDRTFHSALAVKEWMLKNDMQINKMNLVSLGPHARRSTNHFQEVFESEVEIGSIAIESRDYDSDRWYASSEGVRSTLNEAIAYVYAVILQ